MKMFRASVAVFLLLNTFPANRLLGQAFVGTNAPGTGSNFTFAVGAGATNLSLVISNSASAYSYLLIKNGGTPTDTVFDWVARLNGTTNRINLEAPEYAAANYGLRVSTPGTSATHPFQVIMTTNRTDLRSAGYPVLKPLVFSTTGSLTNTGPGAWHYFQVDVPSNLLSGWRIVLSTNIAAGNPDLYVRRDSLPTIGSFDKASVNQQVDTITFTSAEATNSTYFIGVYLGVVTNATYTLSAELASVRTLTWDPGTTDPGTQVYTNQSVNGGDYYFAVTTLATANGAWRTALNVQSGEADVYLKLGSFPSTSTYDYRSIRAGSDGFVLAQGAQFSPAQTWYLMVHATPGAQWTLLTGEAYVQQLPALAADASSGATATMGAEGMHFFKTTISANTLAWRLGLNGLTNQLYVKSNAAPVGYSSSTFDVTRPAQMLVVPTYLVIGNQYFVGVSGDPGLNFTLDSRQQAVTNLSFNSTTNFSVAGYGYTTFVVQVPVQQIAWQVNVTPSSGDASVAIRQNSVPNELVNDAFSEVAAPAADSVTLVPPTLANGTWYVTVYGTAPYTVSLFNGQPVITDVDYVFAITNDAPARAGWRFYRVANTAQQLGSLGWELDLSNQVARTEIAIRRNAVPGRWNYRTSPTSTNTGSLGYVDVSTTSGFLQHPNHQADVWYIGIYSPTNALGDFALTGIQLTGPPIAFDGAGSSTNITAQPAGKFQYFTMTVPANAQGWDLRINGATNGNPYLYVCRDALPSLDNPISWNPYLSAAWPSGYQWQAGYDWTGEYYDNNGTYRYGQVLEMGMGNPLQAGTYYVGVISSTGTNSISYTLVSRGIGTNFAIPIVNLPLTNGIATTNIAAREVAYYSIVVPTNMPSWRLELATNSGEALLMVLKDTVPSVAAGGAAPTILYGGRKLQKAGNEQYLLMPNSGQSNLVAGTYYLAVASEGVNPTYPNIGSGSSSFTLTSYGALSISNIGTVDSTGATDLIVTNSNIAGQHSAFQFVVPPGTLAMAVFLENRVGNPVMTLRMDNPLPYGTDGYGEDGGQAYSWSSPTLINIPNPVATNYTLMVQAVASGGDASYRVRIHALLPSAVTFDGGSSNIVNQPAGVWQYFSITVPANAFGWDLRISGATNGNPYLYVCRDQLPSQSNPNGWNPANSTTWPSGYQWQASYDWTGEYNDNNGVYRYGQILQMGMGNPLQPGTYYVGVISTAGSNPFSYTLSSRGIGTNMSIPVVSMPFTNGVVTSNLPPREVAYYSIVVPTNLPTWRLTLATNSGESLFMLQKGALPSVAAGGATPTLLYGGRKMQKAGNEQYLLMPNSGQTNVIAGTYYLAVASEGMNPNYPNIGSNSSAFTLTSYGTLSISNIGTVDNTGAIDILVTNSTEAGQSSAFQFTVPPATLSLAITLENRVGNPVMTLKTGDQLPYGTDGYGEDGGQAYTWSSPTLINIASPAATNYTMMVQAVASSGDASYRIRVHALGPVPVTDGVSVSITNQPAGTWQYFAINVPSNAFGWDLRISGATNANPYLYVCREQPPSLSNPNGWNPANSTSWPTGYQWAASYDWTSEYNDYNGIYRYAQVLQMGMGNPLQAGTYYAGVISTAGSNPFSYTFLSRFIGTNVSIPLLDLPFTNGIVTNLNLIAREAAYYRVIVPTNVPTWKLRLSNLTGESLLALQKDALPSVAAGGVAPTTLYGGRKMQKAGNEQYLLLPNSGQSTLLAGTYYLLVASEGVNPSYPNIGSNSCSYVLTSYGVQSVTNLGAVGGSDLLSTNSLQGGESALYQFSIPASSNAVEVRLENVTGSPYMALATGTNPVDSYNTYGNDGGVNYAWSSPTLITLPNPTPTNYSLIVQASGSGSLYPDALYTVRVRQMPNPALAFDASLNGPGVSNVVTGTVLNGQSAFYQLTVPATLNSQPVIGWRLNVSQSSGAATIRVRPGALPDGSANTSPFVSTEAIVVPPYLTPGTWYIEVRGSGSLTAYTLTSSNLQLKRPAWDMPVLGNSVTTPGLPPSGPLFGDTGVDTNGVALPGDQGTDLAQGAFDYYTVNVPPGNIGVLRTRLDAISGNPNLYIRFGAASTLSHLSGGGTGVSLYDRTLSAGGGSEYGNWVPLNGRYETYLTNGVWYIAVQAGGSSNVRYRLRLYSGIVNDLALNGGSYSGQTIAAGDWLYYRVLIPTNAPNNWAVTFSEQIGNVVMYVRDRVPPGQGASPTDYRDWVDDDKNHSTAYASYDPPNTYTFTNPPIRPGNTYFLGFRAVNDATFSISCNTNGGYIDYTNTIPFYAGTFTSSVPSHATLKLRIDVPPDARRLIMNFTNVSAFNLYLDQGAVPSRTSSDHFYSLGSANPVLNQPLYSASGWPWLANYMYFLFVTNTSASAQNFAFGVNGQNCATDDADADGLPDCWELAYWVSIFSYGPNDDPDGDGVKNIDEFLEGTSPINPLSFHPRLQITAVNGTVNRNPSGTLTTNVPPKIWYNLGDNVQLTPVPNAGYGFLGWSGDASGAASPLSVTMNGHSNITAIFGVTNQPTADYQFQNNLHSSVGTPPDLTNIAPGNVFTTEIVDGISRPVYRFAQGSSVVLAPANGVIPTNVYTMVLLFRFDNVSGWRRILDVKNPVSDYGLYALNGTLNFYGGASGSTTFANSNYVQVVITHDASSNVVCYLNGSQQFTFVDSGNLGTLAGAPQMIRFFKDNGNEDAAGAIARIRLYDKVMPPAQVATLDRLGVGAAPLQFVQPMYYSNGVMYLTLQLTPNFSYTVQASTSFVNWTTVSNVTSPTPLILISDPQATSFIRRFYRGILN